MSKLHHISDCDFDRYHFDAIRGPELAMVEEHLLWCPYCFRREEEHVRNVGKKGRAYMGHISTDDLERYQLGQMRDAVAIAGIEKHIFDCRECGDRMLAIDRFIGLVLAGVIRRDSLPFPISDLAHYTNRHVENRPGKD